MMRDDAVVLLGAGFALVVLGALSVLWGARVGVLGPALFALLSRFVYGFYSFATGGLDASDASSYHRLASTLAQSDVASAELVSGKESYPIMLSWMYRMFGPAPEIGIVLNCVAAALVPTVIFLACKQLGWTEAAKPAAWIVALWPVGILWQGLLLREAVVILLLAVALWGAASVRGGRVLRGGLMLAASGLLMLGFRGGLAYIPLLVLPASLALVTVVSGHMKATTKIASGLLISVLALVSIPTLDSIASEAGYFDTRSRVVSTSASNTGTTSISGTGGGAGDGTILSGIRNLPTATVGPYPWHWSNGGYLAAGLDGILWLVGTVLAIIGIRSLRDRWSSILCLAPLLLLLIYLGAGASNFGLIMRLRGVGIPFLAPLAALGIVAVLARRHKRRAKRQLLAEQRRDLVGVTSVRSVTPASTTT